MKDTFDIRKFLTENKLTNNSKNLEENRSPFPEDWELDSDQEPPVFDEDEIDLEEAKTPKSSISLTKKGKDIKISKSIKEEQNGLRFNPKPNKVTGAAPEKSPRIPPTTSSYILGPTQLNILKNWTPPGQITSSPGAKIVGGTLYVLISMIPELEGKRGRGGKYVVRDHIKASYGKIPAKIYSDEKSRGEAPNPEGMEVLKAINYAILSSPNKSVQLPGKKGGHSAMLDYKAIPGKVVDGGYEIPAAPKKDKVEEINNLNENTIVGDNFDLKAFISSKRMFTENFEPMEIDEDANSDIIPYDKVLELAKKAADVVSDAKFALIELAINRGKEEGVSRKDVEDTLEEYDMSIDYLENPDEEYEGIENISNSEDDEIESLDEVEVDYDSEHPQDEYPEHDDEWYKIDDEEEIDFGTDLSDYELPGGFEWEDDNGPLYEAEDELDDDEEIDDSEWYKDDDDEDIDFGTELGDYELPDEFGWEDN